MGVAAGLQQGGSREAAWRQAGDPGGADGGDEVTIGRDHMGNMVATRWQKVVVER